MMVVMGMMMALVFVWYNGNEDDAGSDDVDRDVRFLCWSEMRFMIFMQIYTNSKRFRGKEDDVHDKESDFFVPGGPGGGGGGYSSQFLAGVCGSILQA